MNDPASPPANPVDPTRLPGAILNEAQVKQVKRAIIVMTALLVIGLVALFARIIYLATNRGDANRAGVMGGPGQAGVAVPLLADVKLSLPSGAKLTGSSLQGSRLLAQYTSSTGDGLIVLDLATGRPLSHVKVDALR